LEEKGHEIAELNREIAHLKKQNTKKDEALKRALTRKEEQAKRDQSYQKVETAKKSEATPSDNSPMPRSATKKEEDSLLRQTSVVPSKRTSSIMTSIKET